MEKLKFASIKFLLTAHMDGVIDDATLAAALEERDLGE